MQGAAPTRALNLIWAPCAGGGELVHPAWSRLLRTAMPSRAVASRQFPCWRSNGGGGGLEEVHLNSVQRSSAQCCHLRLRGSAPRSGGAKTSAETLSPASKASAASPRRQWSLSDK